MVRTARYGGFFVVSSVIWFCIRPVFYIAAEQAKVRPGSMTSPSSVIICKTVGERLRMNNTKSLILKERARAAWVIVWLMLLIANVIVYINNPASLTVDEGSKFTDWAVKFLSPHNWLLLATGLLTIYGLRAIWLMFEQKWPIIKDFRLMPVVIVVSGILIFIGVVF